MRNLLDIFSGGGRNSEKAQAVLAQLNTSRTPQRIEIESSSFHFQSRVTLRTGAVVLSYPEEMQDALATGGKVRICGVAEGKEDLRLEISSTQYGGTGPMATEPGYRALLCKIPGARVDPRKRAAERWNTARYKGVRLALSSQASAFRIMDISQSGLKIRLKEEQSAEQFPIGQYQKKGVVYLGEKARLQLLEVIPRSHFSNAVGMEMVLNPNSNSPNILTAFLGILQRDGKGNGKPSAPSATPA